MTLATLVSRICMKATTITVSVIAHLRMGEIGASGSVDVIVVEAAGDTPPPYRLSLTSSSGADHG